MAECFRRTGKSGGIISLAKSLDEHRGAIEYDLLTKTGHSIDDIGRSLSWESLDSFFRYIGPDSALMREMYPELAEWGNTVKTNKILADIWDMLAQINANIVAVGSGKPARKPKPYKRPGQQDPVEERHFGKGALPPDELREWFENKRKQLCQK